MKKFLFSLIAVTAIISMLGSMTFTAAPASVNNTFVAEGYETVLENDGYALAFNKENTDTAVLDKGNNKIWYAVPENADSDGIASEEIINQLKSHILISYYENQSLITMDSYTNCIKDGNFKFSVSDGILSVTYNIGDTTFSADTLPLVISQKRLEKDILSKLSEQEKAQILKRYKLFSKKELDTKTYKSIKMNYPSIEKQNIYIRNTMPEYIAEEVYALFQKAGYTTEDLQRDCDDNKIENPYKEKPYFVITLNYELTEYGFKASIAPDKCEYLEDYKPCRISVLPYFGAKDTQETGFMLVPDGCGSMIELNNGKLTADGYWKTFFGDDAALSKSEQLSSTQPSVLPVFACSSGNGSFLASIESGYESAGISADIAGKLNSYNYIYSFYTLFSTDIVSLSGSSGDNFIPSSENIFSDDIEISYHLYESNVTYSDLAVRYREILTKNGQLKKSDYKAADVSIEFLASAGVTKRFLGIPYNSTAALSTYSQATEVIKKLDGITADVNYKYALSGGYRQKSASKLSLLSMLGSREDRENLETFAESFAISYFALRAENLKNSDSAKTLSRSNAKIYEYDPVSGYFEATDAFSLVSASKLNKYLSGIKKSIKSSKLKSLNILDVGYQLHSDFNLKNELDRHKTREAIEEYLKSLSNEAELFVDTGSIFSFPYSDKITNIPSDHSGYKIEDTAIPFYQIVISGYLPYSAPSINSAPDSETAFLKAVEYGAQLQYTWICKKPENVLRIREDYYGFLYSDFIESAKEYINSYKELYSSIEGSSITEHIIYSDELTKTVYDNGIAVLVNYGDEVIEADGRQIEPKSFCLIGGEVQ